MAEKDKDDLTQEEALKAKRIVPMVLRANFFLTTAALLATSVGPKVYMELDTVLSGCPIESSSPDERAKCIAALAGELGGKFISCQALACLLSIGALGTMSDTFGRKPFLIASAVGVCLTMAGMIFAVGGTPGGTSIFFVVLALSGLLGNQDIFVKATLADVSTPEEAPANFAAITTNLGLGLLVGGIGGEVVVKVFGTLKAGGVFGLCCALSGLALLVAMPEPLPKKCSKPVQWARANPFGSMAFLFSKSYLSLFALMLLCQKSALSLCIDNLGIFCMVSFGEGSPYVLLIIFLGVGTAVVCKALLPKLLRRLDPLNTIKLGFVLQTFGYITVVFVTPLNKFGFMFVPFTLFCLGSVCGPTQASAVTLCVTADEQGTLQSAIGSMEILSRVLGPLAGAMVWKFAGAAGNFSYLWWGGAAFLVPAVVAAFALPGVLPVELAQRISSGKDEQKGGKDD